MKRLKELFLNACATLCLLGILKVSVVVFAATNAGDTLLEISKEFLRVNSPTVMDSKIYSNNDSWQIESTGWSTFTGTILTGIDSLDDLPQTDGALALYTGDEAPALAMYYQGGTHTEELIPRSEWTPDLEYSGSLICFYDNEYWLVEFGNLYISG